MSDVVYAQWPASFVVPEEEATKTSAYVEHDLDSLRATIRSVIGADTTKTASAPSGQDIWRRVDAHPLTLLVLVLNAYGQDALEWEPDTLRLTLGRDGHAVSQSAFTKLLAIRVLLTSTSPWKRWNTFHAVCKGLSGGAPNFVYLEEPELGHLMVGAELMRVLDPSRLTGEEVDKYVAAALKNDGQPWAPSPLEFAQRELEEASIECKNCGAIHRDDNDVRCVTCASTDLVKVPYEFAALRDEVAKLYGERIKRAEAHQLDGLTDTPGGRCAARLLEAGHYAQFVHAALVQQAKEFKL